jgi:cyclopropane-fatty-acyl-phospholipid synthase
MPAALDALAIRLAESGRVPDAAVRAGIRRIVADRARETRAPDFETRLARKRAFLEGLRDGPIARATDRANEQHYELPPAFFEAVLGPRLKYSCALFDAGVRSLDEAEERMLATTCARAGLTDGMRVLDLGCGWGSLSLWIAERFPASRVLGVSNSKPQREFILGRAAARGLTNVEVVTADVNAFDPERRFDRVVSVEMFEHVQNHAALLARVAGWLTPEGRLFVHHFCHREAAYPYETDGSRDWMGRYFFTGGIMPSEDLLLHHQRDLEVEAQWRVSGRHYEKTSNAWLARQDASRDAVTAALVEAYGRDEAEAWRQRWRMFFMACAELFGFRGGDEWFVTHVRMAPRSGGAR